MNPEIRIAKNGQEVADNFQACIGDSIEININKDDSRGFSIIELLDSHENRRFLSRRAGDHHTTIIIPNTKLFGSWLCQIRIKGEEDRNHEIEVVETITEEETDETEKHSSDLDDESSALEERMSTDSGSTDEEEVLMTSESDKTGSEEELGTPVNESQTEQLATDVSPLMETDDKTTGQSDELPEQEEMRTETVDIEEESEPEEERTLSGDEVLEDNREPVEEDSLIQEVEDSMDDLTTEEESSEETDLSEKTVDEDAELNIPDEVDEVSHNEEPLAEVVSEADDTVKNDLNETTDVEDGSNLTDDEVMEEEEVVEEIILNELIEDEIHEILATIVTEEELARILPTHLDTDTRNDLQIPIAELEEISKEHQSRLRADELLYVSDLLENDPSRLQEVSLAEVTDVVEWLDQAYLILKRPEHGLRREYRRLRSEYTAYQRQLETMMDSKQAQDPLSVLVGVNRLSIQKLHEEGIETVGQLLQWKLIDLINLEVDPDKPLLPKLWIANAKSHVGIK